MPLDRLPALTADPLRQRIVDQLRPIGFLHVALDLEGYVSGSMNRALDGDLDSNSETAAAQPVRKNQ